MRDDVVRGLRLGAVLLVLLFGGMAAYRVSKDLGAARLAEPGPKPARRPARVRDLWSGPAIPPPPPPLRKPAARRPIAARVPQVIEPAEEDKVVEPEESKTEGSDKRVVEEADAGSASEPEDSARKREPRVTRMLKTVGRFLHIVPQK